MAVAVVPVLESEKAVLWDGLQPYIAELAQWGTHKPVDGVYEYPWFDLYWREPNRFPFWAEVDGVRTGFALVYCAARTEMAEFYSFPKFRRSGLALDFARQILKRFPGLWTLSEYHAHTASVAFWHKAIADYPYAERVYFGEQGVERLEQTFTVPGAVPCSDTL
jgi:predicted acetyltransferase